MGAMPLAFERVLLMGDELVGAGVGMPTEAATDALATAAATSKASF